MRADDESLHLPDAQLREVMKERRRLVSLAYRMTGTLAEAEDVVQDSYVRWYRMSDAERAAIANPAAWLTRVASRLALDVLKSARVRRERQSGQWLPEPVPEDLFAGTGAEGTVNDAADPLDRVTLDDEVSTALLVVLESLTPAERVAFVLHDVFAVPFDEIGDLVGRSSEAARQLASSARRHVRAQRTAAVPRSEHDSVVRAFRDASLGGSLSDLVRILAPGVELRADGGGVVRVAPNAIVGPDRVARFLLGVLEKQPRLQLEERRTADGLGLAMVVDGHLLGIASFHVADSGITDLWLVLDPGKLREWDAS